MVDHRPVLGCQRDPLDRCACFGRVSSLRSNNSRGNQFQAPSYEGGMWLRNERCLSDVELDELRESRAIRLAARGLWQLVDEHPLARHFVRPEALTAVVFELRLVDRHL